MFFFFKEVHALKIEIEYSDKIGRHVLQGALVNENAVLLINDRYLGSDECQKLMLLNIGPKIPCFCHLQASSNHPFHFHCTSKKSGPNKFKAVFDFEKATLKIKC